MIAHGRRGGNPDRAITGQKIDRFAGDWLAEWQIFDRDFGEELEERSWIDDRAGEIVLAQAAGLVDDPDFDWSE